MNLVSDLIIECSRCHNNIYVSKYDLEPTMDSYERNMGEELVYTFEEELDCDYCGNSIRFAIFGYEYPFGCFNYQNYEISGGVFSEDPNLIISNYYDFDEATIYSGLSDIQEIISRISCEGDYVYKLTSREFEELVAELFMKDGFDVELTKPTRDGGRDIVAKKDIKGCPFVVIVECKKYDMKNKVSVDIIRSLYGVQTADNVNKAIVVTTSTFTKDAIDFASKTKTMIDLVDFDGLMNWIQQYND